MFVKGLMVGLCDERSSWSHTHVLLPEIIDFRKNVWGAINKRKQVVRKVWVSDEDRRDIVVLGDVTFGHESGQTITEQFVGNFLFGSGEDEGLIQRYQAWLVSPSTSNPALKIGAVAWC